jgi:hypothetical protein
VALIASVIVYRNLPANLRAPVMARETEPKRPGPVTDEVPILAE